MCCLNTCDVWQYAHNAMLRGHIYELLHELLARLKSLEVEETAATAVTPPSPVAEGDINSRTRERRLDALFRCACEFVTSECARDVFTILQPLLGATNEPVWKVPLSEQLVGLYSHRFRFLRIGFCGSN